MARRCTMPPHDCYIGRPDEVNAARKPVLTYSFA